MTDSKGKIFHKKDDNQTDQGDIDSEGEKNKYEERLKELTNDLQRTRADFENYRKQIELQKSQERRMVKLSTVTHILPLLDDMERAITSYEELKPLAVTLSKTMKELGLEKIEIADDTEFNPELHEAVIAEGDGDKETITEVLRPGYYYDGEVLRPSMVKVKKI